jgi:hypothetical protein
MTTISKIDELAYRAPRRNFDLILFPESPDERTLARASRWWRRGDFASPIQNARMPKVCSDNSSIMRTVELSLTNVFKRFVGRICDLAETRAPRPVREGNQRLRYPKCLSP